MEEWNTGYPKQQGWFDVKIDGEYDRAQHWVCSISGKHHWKSLNGEYLEVFHRIEWTGEAEMRP